MKSIKQWWTDYKYHKHKIAELTKVEHACMWLIKECGTRESYSETIKYENGDFVFCYRPSHFSFGIFKDECYWIIYKGDSVYKRVGVYNLVTFLYGSWTEQVAALQAAKHEAKYKDRFGEYIEK